MSAPDRDDATPIETGAFVAVVGASGAGKDTVLAHVRRALAGEPRIAFARRVVTRTPDPASEDHDGLTEAAFAQAEARGAFAVTWKAHGLSYGVPASVDTLLRSGGVAVVNGSRAAVPALAGRYTRLVVVEITAAPEVLAKRLAARGRESAEQVQARLQRRVDTLPAGIRTICIDNGGPIEQAGEALVALLRALLDEPA
jgi:ribose 1,5-bisphosphokinase